MNKLIIIGAGGHGRVVADCARATKKYDKIDFLDACYRTKTTNLNWSIVGPVDDWKKHLSSADFIVAFGNNQLRLSIIDQLLKSNASVVNIIHPTAYISDESHLAKGCVVFANAVVNIASSIQNGCIINTGATVDHDCTLAEAVHISPGANIAGGVSIGKYSWVGIGSCVTECLSLAENTVIGAGSVVINSTEPHSLYVGVPAKKIKTLE